MIDLQPGPVDREAERADDRGHGDEIPPFHATSRFSSRRGHHEPRRAVTILRDSI